MNNPDNSEGSFVGRHACPACGSTRSQTIFDRPYRSRPLWDFMTRYYSAAQDLDYHLGDERFIVAQCMNCILVYQKRVGTDELLSRLYDSWLNETYYPGTESFRVEIENFRLTRDAHELFAAAHALRLPLEKMTVLDYGMGWGLWAQIASKLGCLAYGYDLSHARCMDAERRGVRVVSPMEFSGLGAHFVNADQIIEHCVRPLEVLREMVTALAPHGILKISVPRADDIARRLQVANWEAPRGTRNHLHPIQPLEHVNCFTWKALRALCDQAGLRPAQPTVLDYLAFARTAQSLSLRQPRRLAKAIARPVYNWFNPNQIYAWFVKK